MHLGTTQRRLTCLTFAMLLTLNPVSIAGQAVRSVHLAPPIDVSRVQFTQVTSIRELSTGEVLIADRGEQRLAVMNWSSESAPTVGRHGEGPGEYTGMGRVYPMSLDSTFLVEVSGRSHLLDGTKIVRTFGVTDLGRPNRHSIKGASASRLLALAPRGGRRLVGSADSLIILLVRREPYKEDSVAVMKGTGGIGEQVVRPSGNRPGRIVTANPLVTADQAVLSPDGWLAVVHSTPYQVEWRSPTGRWSRHNLPFERVRLTDTEKCAAMYRLMRQPLEQCEPNALEGWPQILPPFENSGTPPMVLATSANTVAIRRLRRSDSSDITYDVVDRRGQLVCQLVVSSNEYLVGFGLESVYVVAIDDMDLQTLRRHHWPSDCSGDAKFNRSGRWPDAAKSQL